MTKARKLDKRRNSIRNIRKITRTMELISSTRFQRAKKRLEAATPYTERMTSLVGHLVHSGLEVSHPLLQPRKETNHAVLLVLTANRGMCGGYNSNVIRLAIARRRELMETIGEVRLEVSGKRGISSFRFRKIQPDEAFVHFEYKPSFEEVEVLAGRYLQSYQAGRLDRLDVAYTKFESFGRQQAVIETLLPLADLEGSEEEETAPGGRTEYEFLPSAESIVDEVVPASFEVKLFKCFLDAAVSEQITRMLAMQAATENADSMIDQLSTAYNRARQGQITSELLEVIGGAEALNPTRE